MAHVLKHIIKSRNSQKKKNKILEFYKGGQSNGLGIAYRWAKVGPYVG